MKRYRGIGLMSGTSLDGVDLAYCEFTEKEGAWSFELLAAETFPYDEQWYARLRCVDDQSAEVYAKTHVYFGHHLGRVLAEFIERNELKPQFVASHGQTIFH
ncbi:MAG: anhydro-N-acetylmuramic acid kinase, partial [Bacteroidota bacterium]